MYKIGKLRRELIKIGVDLTDEQIRRYDKIGLISSKRNKNNGYREFSEEEFNIAKRNIFLYHIGIPAEIILGDKKLLAIEIARIIAKLSEYIKFYS